MATTERVRTIANRPRKRRRRNMSLKQRAFFGKGKARADAQRRLAGSRSRKNTKKRKHRPSSARPRTGTRRNGGEIIGFTMPNRGSSRKGGHSVAKAKRKRKNTSHRSHATKRRRRSYASNRRHYRRNTGHRPRSRPRHRRNPSLGGSVGSLGHLVTNGVFVIIGALGSKLGAQAVLGSNNTGWMGYGGNALAGAVLWFLADKVMKNKAASAGIVAGTVVQILLRMINDFTPFGQYTSQLGMGDYQMQSFVTPQVLVDPTNSADIAIPPGWAPQIVAPPAGGGKGVSGYGWGGHNLYGGQGLY